MTMRRTCYEKIYLLFFERNVAHGMQRFYVCGLEQSGERLEWRELIESRYPGSNWYPVLVGNNETVGATYKVVLKRSNGTTWYVELVNNLNPSWFLSAKMKGDTVMNIFHRRQLISSYNEGIIHIIEDLLCSNGVPYDVKVYDRSSPSIFNMDTRERFGGQFQSSKHSYCYRIYVSKENLDYSKALIKNKLK